MKKTAGRPVLRSIVALLFVVPAATASIAAESACVTCEGPTATYSCSPAPNAGPELIGLAGRKLQFSCIEDIAKRYQHATCSVRRNQLGTCIGIVHMLTGQEAASAPAASPGTIDGQAGLPPSGETKSVDPSPHGAPVAATKKAAPAVQNSEPKTVVELAKRTAITTQNEIDRSADKVSKAARSTWRCISTLFQDC